MCGKTTTLQHYLQQGKWVEVCNSNAGDHVMQKINYYFEIAEFFTIQCFGKLP